MKTVFEYLVPILAFLGMTINRDRAGTVIRIVDDSFFYYFHIASPIILTLWLIWQGSKYMGKYNTFKQNQNDNNNNLKRCR